MKRWKRILAGELAPRNIDDCECGWCAYPFDREDMLSYCEELGEIACGQRCADRIEGQYRQGGVADEPV